MAGAVAELLSALAVAAGAAFRGPGAGRTQIYVMQVLIGAEFVQAHRSKNLVRWQVDMFICADYLQQLLTSVHRQTAQQVPGSRLQHCAL